MLSRDEAMLVWWRNEPRVERRAFFDLRSDAAAVEVAQHVFNKLEARDWVGFERESSLKAWINTVARRMTIDVAKARAKQSPKAETEIAALLCGGLDSEPALLRPICWRCLKGCARELTAFQWGVFADHGLRGMEHSEIAEKRDITVTDSTTAKSKAMAKLFPCMRTCLGVEP